MPIQISPSAAGLSWLALCESLKNRAVMEGAIFSLLGENTKMSLTQTNNQATALQAGLEAVAHQELMKGITGVIGGAASIGATVTSSVMQGVNERKATSLSNTTTNELTIEETNGSKLIEMKDMSKPAQKGSADIDGNNIIKESSASSSKTKVEDDIVKNNERLKKGFENNSQWWMQTGKTASDIANLATNAASSFAVVNDIKEQGKQKAAEAIAAGIGQVISAQNGLFTSALSSCDNFIGNTNSTVAAIIAASKA